MCQIRNPPLYRLNRYHLLRDLSLICGVRKLQVLKLRLTRDFYG